MNYELQSLQFPSIILFFVQIEVSLYPDNPYHGNKCKNDLTNLHDTGLYLCIDFLYYERIYRFCAQIQTYDL